MAKLTFEKRIKILSEISPEIELIDEFIGKDGKYWCTYKCSCGNIDKKSWNGLQGGNNHCSICNPKKELTFYERVEILKKRNPEIILLSVRRGSDHKAKCTCKTTFSDETFERDWSNLTQRITNKPTPKEEKIKKLQKVLDGKGIKFEVIDFVKVDNITKVKYKCSCGEILIKNRPKLLKGEMCVNCPENTAFKLKSLEEKQKIIDNIYGKTNTKLLRQFNDYNDSGEKRVFCEFICDKCGEKSIKQWNLLRLAPHCFNCRPNRKLTIDERREIIKEANPGIEILSEFKKNGDWWVKYICTCGNIKTKVWEKLRIGEKCGECFSSRGETKIQILLVKHGIKYKKNKTFDGLVGVGGKKLSYDFYLPQYNTLIEYDGEFHYIPIKLSESMTDDQAIKNFEKQKRHDNLKTNYALKNKINLIRIPYMNYEDVNEILTEKLNLKEITTKTT